MSQGRSLSCQNPETSALKVIAFERTQPKPGDIEVAVEAASVNPIDVQRATGYGRKLLSLLGAGTFPMTLGNDFSGTITAVGSEVTGFSVGDRVFGAKKALPHGDPCQPCSCQGDARTGRLGAVRA